MATVGIEAAASAAVGAASAEETVEETVEDLEGATKWEEGRSLLDHCFSSTTRGRNRRVNQLPVPFSTIETFHKVSYC